ncbi:MAG: polysaccharide pyruvyl transferase family protein [Chryseobacterium sp.]|nr:polysaccharide pyruvyl transferase family protein [Chryseobacterium sp.]
MTYTLVNAYCKENIGDDLFIKILLDRYPSTNFIILGKKEKLSFLKENSNVKIENIYQLGPLEKVVLKFGIKNYNDIKRKKWNHFLERYKNKIDNYIILGGSMFIEEKNHNFETTELIFQNLNLAKKIVVGSNFGPYHTAKFYDFYKHNFATFDAVIFRDSYSKKLFDDVSSVRNLTDFVFNYNISKSFDEKIPNSIGISVINLSHREKIKKHEQDYLTFLRKIILDAKEENKECFLFSFCAAEGDDVIVKQLSQEFPFAKPVYYDGNIDSFLSVYSSMQTVVATRFHGLVLSLLFNQKVLGVIYSEKTLNLINDMDKNIKYIELDNLNRYHSNQLKELEVLDISKTISSATQYFETLDNFLK